MKKDYKAPKAEKMEFNYSETVVASTKVCGNITTYSQMVSDGEYCNKIIESHYVSDKV